LATSSATDVFGTIAADAAAESALWGDALRPEPEHEPVFGELVPERVWSFEDVTLEGARALSDERTGDPPLLTGPLTTLDDVEIGMPVEVVYEDNEGYTLPKFRPMK
jgi:hypothetical protein